jgi:hypothetical protein
MVEFIPSVIGFLLGSVILRTSSGVIRIVFSATAIVLTGLFATFTSGEFYGDWLLHLFIDISEASVGFTGILATAFIGWLCRGWFVSGRFLKPTNEFSVVHPTTE